MTRKRGKGAPAIDPVRFWQLAEEPAALDTDLRLVDDPEVFLRQLLTPEVAEATRDFFESAVLPGYGKINRSIVGLACCRNPNGSS